MMAKATEKDNQTDDAMPEEMAEQAMTETTEEWEDVRVGLGREWDFDKDGKFLVAVYQGPTEVDLPDDPERDKATAHQFLLLDETGEIVFLWGSHELNSKMDEIGHSEKVRISFLGRDSFTSDTGPRQVKRYKVQRVKK
jgi:hypothetical protein